MSDTDEDSVYSDDIDMELLSLRYQLLVDCASIMDFEECTTMLEFCLQSLGNVLQSLDGSLLETVSLLECFDILSDRFSSNDVMCNYVLVMRRLLLDVREMFPMEAQSSKQQISDIESPAEGNNELSSHQIYVDCVRDMVDVLESLKSLTGRSKVRNFVSKARRQVDLLREAIDEFDSVGKETPMESPAPVEQNRYGSADSSKAPQTVMAGTYNPKSVEMGTPAEVQKNFLHSTVNADGKPAAKPYETVRFIDFKANDRFSMKNAMKEKHAKPKKFNNFSNVFCHDDFSSSSKKQDGAQFFM